MNHIHGTRRLSVALAVALAALAGATALALPGFQGTATAAVHGPQYHHAARVTAQQTHIGGTRLAGRVVCPPHLPKCYG
jgi:hypothetical protein